MKSRKFSPLSLTTRERKMKNLYGNYFEVPAGAKVLTPQARRDWYDAVTYQIMLSERDLGVRLVNRRLIEKLSKSGKNWIFGWKAQAVKGTS